ncbi:MAG: DUF2513 domain-containing protein [Planctomycetes bacterium]|nr:DUF2513 domain-containing protein [Planctomycetota bacterium]
MKRDLDLVRKILFAVEEHASGFAPTDLHVEGYTKAQIGYHAYLVVDAGLAQGEDVTDTDSEGPEWMITALTWKGHEFVEAARDDSRWERAKRMVADKGGSITFDLLKQLLTSLMKGALGLP